MKTCLICGATAQDNCATCPKCGEGSWGGSDNKMSESEPVKPTEPEPLESPKAPDPKPSTQDKRDPRAKR
jgi:uncharacterized membrane protein YvbJ